MKTSAVNHVHTSLGPASCRTLVGFVLLAWVFTWGLAWPAAAAWIRREVPGPGAVACAGLSAFGPFVSAFVFGARERALRDTFGRFQTRPVWILLALFAPVTLHLAATVSWWAAGGRPSAWFHPPQTSEQLAALVVFPIGEEFGWRGFAQPRFARRFGEVRGSLLVGAVWALWHLMYSITPQRSGFDPFAFGLTVVELPLYSLLIAWVFRRARRSMAVAVAFHAGAHLDHIERAPSTELGLHVAHVCVLAIIAAWAARSLSMGGPAPQLPGSAGLGDPNS